MNITAALQAKLKSSYDAYARGHDLPPRPGVRLPGEGRSGSLVRFEGNEQDVIMRLGTGSIVANMQSNSASFEAWALILRIWCDVGTVALAWDPPTDETDRHYQRFLYRVDRFQGLFADWFSVADVAHMSAARFLPMALAPLLLNVPSKARPTLKELLAENAVRKLAGEMRLELMLCRSREFEAHYGLDTDRVERQIPVGLFREQIADKRRVFSGGKSAIDLVGMSGSTLWLFELKAGGNIPAGIISELFFYTSVLRDASEAGPFAFVQSAESLRVTSTELSKCKNIEAVMLGESLHPLVDHPGIVELLNNAVAANWNGRAGYPDVRFRLDRVDSSEPLRIQSVH